MTSLSFADFRKSVLKAVIETFPALSESSIEYEDMWQLFKSVYRFKVEGINLRLEFPYRYEPGIELFIYIGEPDEYQYLYMCRQRIFCKERPLDTWVQEQIIGLKALEYVEKLSPRGRSNLEEYLSSGDAKWRYEGQFVYVPVQGHRVRSSTHTEYLKRGQEIPLLDSYEKPVQNPKVQSVVQTLVIAIENLPPILN